MLTLLFQVKLLKKDIFPRSSRFFAIDLSSVNKSLQFSENDIIFFQREEKCMQVRI